MYYFSHSMASRQLERQAELLARRDDLRERLEQLQLDHELNADYGERFRRDRDDGVYAIGQRLAWIELFKHVGKDLRLPSLRYQISARKPYYSKVVVQTDALGVYTTGVALNAELFHEGDLLVLQERFAHAHLGLFNLSACDIQRRQGDEKGASNPDKALLKADCTIDWASFVFDDPDKKNQDPVDTEGVF